MKSSKRLKKSSKISKKKETSFWPSSRLIIVQTLTEFWLNSDLHGLLLNKNEPNYKLLFPTSKRNSEKKPISVKYPSANTTNKFVISQNTFKNIKIFIKLI